MTTAESYTRQLNNFLMSSISFLNIGTSNKYQLIIHMDTVMEQEVVVVAVKRCILGMYQTGSAV